MKKYICKCGRKVETDLEEVYCRNCRTKMHEVKSIIKDTESDSKEIKPSSRISLFKPKPRFREENGIILLRDGASDCDSYGRSYEDEHKYDEEPELPSSKKIGAWLRG